MDILTKNKVGSDVPLMEKQRKPIYKGKNRTSSLGVDDDRIDNISRYVKTNMAKTVKPRGSENR